MVKYGSDVNLSDRENMLFIVVCKGGYVNVVEELIKVNVDVNLSGGNFKMLKFINVLGCIDDVYNLREYLNVGLFLEDIYKILLIVVCVGRYICIVEILIEVGVDVNLSDG